MFVAGVVIALRVPLYEWWLETQQPTLPEPVPYNSLGAHKVNSEIELTEQKSTQSQQGDRGNEETVLRDSSNSAYSVRSTHSINLAVPFTSQAPHGNWDSVHKEACEEASVLMLDAFFDGRALTPEGAEAELQELVQWQMNRFGYFEDTSAEETAIMLREFYGYTDVTVHTLPTLEGLRALLLRGVPVIVPVYGRALGNPYFQQPGPVYHVLVVRGLTDEGKFITNDPGTRRGEAYIYDAEVLWEAIHDWNGGDVERGEKVMIVVKP
jgi:hypothetical protein